MYDRLNSRGETLPALPASGGVGVGEGMREWEWGKSAVCIAFIWRL